MEYPIYINEQQAEVLKTIFEQISTMPLIVAPVSKPKKLSKKEQTAQYISEWRAKKAARKSK